jgi:hypothetical protein
MTILTAEPAEIEEPDFLGVLSALCGQKPLDAANDTRFMENHRVSST